MKPTTIKASIGHDGQDIDLQIGKATFNDAFFTEFKIEPLPNGERLRLTIHPKQTLRLEHITLRLKYEFKSSDKVFCNGYQSWSPARSYDANEQQKAPSALVKPFTKYLGDYTFYNYPNTPGKLHSWTYTYLTRKGLPYLFLGSILEYSGFVVFEHDTANGTIDVRKDCKGLVLDHSYPVFDIVILTQDKLEKAFDQYFELAEIKPFSAQPAWGYTSWYQHFNKIDEALVLQTLRGMQSRWQGRVGLSQVFQVDDGWQHQTGDWLRPSAAFPSGMDQLARNIKQAGFVPGIWMAPFAVSGKSAVFRDHKDWLLKDQNGKPLKAGYNPYWGWFYALDFYNPKAQDYIRDMLLLLSEKWGFQFFKLDFLYLAAIQPPASKTRGQVMHEAMDFLRRILGDRPILACGVPMSAAFGKVDYCRIGPDVHTSWEHTWLKWLNLPERPSTHNSLVNTFGRYPLHQRAFMNDPDVFILRRDKQALKPIEQDLLFVLNNLLGGIAFNSDAVHQYDASTQERFQLSADMLRDAKVQSCTFLNDEHFEILFNWNNQRFQVKGSLGQLCGLEFRRS
jgi:alpha-galactosidase